MFLKALEIQGFKSFPDKTKINFEAGITAVVGPNGSGKSNISDAMRWVLGETSSKQLRGAGKMEDVIFGGTRMRGPMGFAAVSIYIDNVQRRLEVDQDEVVITRRYYRSGESEYAINGQSVRLKDVYELLLDTGVGRDGYSIIGQGKIAEIVGAKSAERREIFEEASGIAKYRYRKNEAERKLTATEDNLVRLRDILGELEERVGPLKRDSEKAHKFLEYSAQRKGLEITLWLDSIEKAKETLRTHARGIETAQADYDDAQRKFDAAQQQQEDAFMQSRRLESAGEEFAAAANAAAAAYAQTVADIAVLEADIKHIAADIAMQEDLLAQTGESSAELAAQNESYEALITRHKEKLGEVLQALAELSQQLLTLTQESAHSDELRAGMQAKLDAYFTTRTELRVEIAAGEGRQPEMEARLATAREEAQQVESDLAQQTKESAQAKDFAAELAAKRTTLENILAGTQMKVNAREKKLADASNAKLSADRALENARQRENLLKELERSMDGYTASVKTVMKAGQNGQLRGLLGPVSSLVRVHAGYEVALETALGYSLQNIVVENENAAKEAIAYLKRTNAGRATFLPLDTVQPRSLDRGVNLNGAIAASEIVSCDEKYNRVVSNLLGRILVVDDINAASRVARETGYKYRIVTKDGQLVGAGGSFTGGSVARSTGVFSRKLELEELSKKVITLTQQLEAAAAAEREVNAEMQKLTAELSATQGELSELREDEIRCEMEIGRTGAVCAQLSAGKDALLQEVQDLERGISENEKTLENAGVKLTETELAASALEEEIARTGEQGSGFVERRNELSQRQQALLMDKLTIEKDIETAQDAQNALMQRAGGEMQRAQALKEKIAQLHADAQSMNESAAAMQETLAAHKMQEDAAREGAGKAREERMELERQTELVRAQNRTLSDDKERLSKEVARLEERQTALQTEYDGTIARLWEEYELTPAGAAIFKVEYETITELRREVGEVRGKIRALGHVNVGAIEEYKEVSERYEFLGEQVGDVERSRAELLKMIEHLKGDMQSIFKESFVQINDNFGRIFTQLFGGGTARLYLSDEDDVLESGIEIEVAPPGKIIKSLNALSGGEQALVAIAIYFAILAVNPAPFCVLDEIEAALDDVNVTRFANYLRQICGQTQFIVITHRRGTMEEANILYGVTMQEDGVSKILRLDPQKVSVELVS